ncbi:MAG: hypothetical protein Q8882_06115, partial [Bacillota bacterium]|nr:hypothetical protein [Bacillota bacterium]
MRAKNMRAKNIIIFLIVVAIIFMSCFVCMFDVTIGDFRFPSALDKEYGIKQGLELVGGSLIEFKPEEGVTPTAEQMDTVQSIIRSRLDSQAYYDATVTVQKDNSVRIEIPDVEDPSEAVSILGSTAKLTFRDYQGNILMEGTNEYVANAQREYGQTSQASAASYYVSLELTSAGREAFKKATQTVLNYGKDNSYIGIYLDEKAVSKPSVTQVIDSDKCVITGSFDKEGASTLAAQIRSGQLPFKLEVGQV